MLGEYILAGFKIAMIIAAMLIGFIALISAVNALFSAVLGISFQQILGYVFYPLAWLIGIPAEEALKAGSIMATKLVANEFVAMIELKKIAAELSPRGLGILSVFPVSFANFASIGIVAGAIKGLNEQQGNVVSRFGLKLVYGSTLVSLLSAAIAGRCCNPHSRPYGREFAKTPHTPAHPHASPNPAQTAAYSRCAAPRYSPHSLCPAHGSTAAPCCSRAPACRRGPATALWHQRPSARL